MLTISLVISSQEAVAPLIKDNIASKRRSHISRNLLRSNELPLIDRTLLDVSYREKLVHLNTLIGRAVCIWRFSESAERKPSLALDHEAWLRELHHTF
jgi:hypothetical protein